MITIRFKCVTYGLMISTNLRSASPHFHRTRPDSSLRTNPAQTRRQGTFVSIPNIEKRNLELCPASLSMDLYQSLHKNEANASSLGLNNNQGRKKF